MLYHWTVYRLRNLSVYQLAFFIGILGGIFGVLVDLDHIPSIFWEGLENRLLHTPVLIMAIGIAIYNIAHLRRLHSELVLRKKGMRKNITTFSQRRKK